MNFTHEQLPSRIVFGDTLDIDIGFPLDRFEAVAERAGFSVADVEPILTTALQPTESTDAP